MHLRNVPPLRDVQVDFKPGLNIIIGKNGSGKTNFMKLLSELAQPYEKKYRGVGCELLLGGGIQELKVTFKENLPEKSASKKLNELRALGNRLPLLVKVSSGTMEGADEIMMEAISVVVLAATSNLYFLESEYFVLPIWHGLPSHRMPIVDEGVDMVLSNTGILELPDANESRWEIGGSMVQALLSTVEGVYHFLNESEMNGLPISLEVARQFIMRAVDCHLVWLNPYLSLYSPLQEVRRSDQFQVYYNTAKDELLVKGLVLEYKIGDDWLPFSALSDGTKRVFYLIGEMVSFAFAYFAELDSEPEFMDNNKIFLLEEPELGIHPQQLQLLLQLIREVSRKHQVILTTHSPQTLDMLSGQELDRITICEYVPGKGTQMRKLSAAKKAKAEAYLRDQGFLSEFWRFSNLEDPD